MTSPHAFIENFMKQPYPTMGLAPSASIATAGPVRVQEGTGASRIGQSGPSMWARIASGFSLDWSLGGITAASAKAVNPAVTAVSDKVKEGAQAVEGKVKSAVEGVFGLTKWILIFAGIGIVAYFLGQVRSFIPAKN